MLFVDDGLMVSNSHAQMDSILDFMKDVFIMKVNMNLELYVGIHIYCDRLCHLIYIDQKLYIDNLLQNSNFQDCHAISTPVELGVHLHSIHF